MGNLEEVYGLTIHRYGEIARDQTRDLLVPCKGLTHHMDINTLLSDEDVVTGLSSVILRTVWTNLGSAWIFADDFRKRVLSSSRFEVEIDSPSGVLGDFGLEYTNDRGTLVEYVQIPKSIQALEAADFKDKEGAKLDVRRICATTEPASEIPFRQLTVTPGKVSTTYEICATSKGYPGQIKKFLTSYDEVLGALRTE
jgi:hypothetical protein